MVSPSSVAAATGQANVTADIQSPTRTKGLNLNIPFLHEVNTTKKLVIAHNALRFACDNGYHGELFLCRRVGLMSDGRARIFILSDFERNDKTNDNNYQFNC
ncbi:colicin I receptor [Salmonella enterica subsp. enterica serovar Typhimurium]|nr:colicin I receptor [Salmonella enterica]EBW4884925.1 colicin I receptor [Salmonella enterica subsp. enterica serovar Typhimurium]ECA4373047.1 colicin I receptor [Salmonella enterica subsp. enterica serovar Infantis]EAS8491207.1 colicin I receptor [Salmonella enterica]EAT7831554.1 colicin I receptor [Salmonella enterica]